MFLEVQFLYPTKSNISCISKFIASHFFVENDKVSSHFTKCCISVLWLLCFCHSTHTYHIGANVLHLLSWFKYYGIGRKDNTQKAEYLNQLSNVRSRKPHHRAAVMDSYNSTQMWYCQVSHENSKNMLRFVFQEKRAFLLDFY